MKKIILLAIFFLTLSGQWVLSQKKYASLQEALNAGRKVRGSAGPASVNWIREGSAYSFIEGVNIIKSFTPATGKEELILDASTLKFPDGKPFTFSTFQWSRDSKYLLFQTNFRPLWRNSGTSDYYYYSITDRSLQLVAQDANTAEISPDGKRVGYESKGNLFVYDFATQNISQLTNDAENQIYNGRFGWVYEEEFGLVQAWQWSPDSKFIAFWQTDERQVLIYQITDYAKQQPEWTKIPYPKVGDKNPEVKIGIVEVNQKKLQWMNLELGDGYVPRVYWTSKSGQLAIVQLNRRQNHVKLWFHQAQTGEGKLIMEEKSDTWLDVSEWFGHYFFFPETMTEFFWQSDRDGFSHIYRYDYSGKVLNQVTQGNWDVESVLNVDATKKMIYYTATEKSPLERHLYQISFDGKKKTILSQVSGRHSFNFSPNSAYFIDTYSNTTTPTQVELWATNKRKIKDLETNPTSKDFIREYTYIPRELTSFTTSDGQKLDIYIVKPVNFDEKKAYPMLLNIYGGPGSQSVFNQFGVDMWEQFLAQEGYVIVSVNNRGSNGYGAKFKKQVYEKLGEWESKDFVETANYMAKFSWIDKNRMAIRGHSYGGYMSAYTVFKYPEVFKVALVGAPVTDWRLYDSIYTERYMGLLPENEAKYQASAPLNFVGKLQAKMLIAHSMMDDNVHVQNTFQMVKALIDKGKDVDLRIYPPGNHGVAYSSNSRLLLFSQYLEYLNRHLK